MLSLKISELPKLPLTPEQKALWVDWIAALRSGTYTQAERALHLNSGFCCLGVACELVKDKVQGEWAIRFDNDVLRIGPKYSFKHVNDKGDHKTEGNVLPSTVMDLYGLELAKGFGVVMAAEGYKFITTLNDKFLNFNGIASVLQAVLEGHSEVEISSDGQKNV